MEKSELKAILTLLEDPDPQVFAAIRESLLNWGIEAVPDLESAWENSNDELFQNRVESIVAEIQYQNTLKRIEEWAKDGGRNIMVGAYWVARYQFPSLELDEVLDIVERIKQDAMAEMSQDLTALEKVKVLNHIIFDVHKFSRNNSNIYSPDNSFIQQVLRSKKGNSISLSLIYAHVAQALGLPIFGVNLPRNFILAFQDENSLGRSETLPDDMLFYINPYSRGTVLSRREIDFYLKSQKMTESPSHYVPCSNVQTIKRLIMTLIVAFEKKNELRKVEELKQIHDALVPFAEADASEI